MANTIRLKSGSGNNPSASDLVLGEVALRTDGNPKLFTKNDAGNVVEVGLVESGSIVAGSIVNADINASAAIAGTKISPNFGGQNIQTTGQLQISGALPTILLNDENNENDFEIRNENGNFKIRDIDNPQDRYVIASTGMIHTFHGAASFSSNLDVGAGLDVTGQIVSESTTGTGSTGLKVTNSNESFVQYFEGGNANADYVMTYVGSGGTDLRFKHNGEVQLRYAGQEKLKTNSSGVTITGNIVVSGDVDGVNVAATRTRLDTLLSSANGNLINGVTATTQSAGDNSTKVATTAYTDTAISNLVDSSPSALNTLNELAAALGDDANFSTTVTNSIATKMPLAGGVFTGDIGTRTLTPASGITNADLGASNLKFRNLHLSGNIVVDGYVDNRDIAADGTKLDGIESNAINASNTAITNKLPLAGGTITGNLILDNATNAGRDVQWQHANDRLAFFNNTKATFGNSANLQIFYDGNDSIISDTATGDLILKTNGAKIAFTTGNGTEIAEFINNGACNLRHQSTSRLTTTSSGVTVTGTCTATSFSGSGASLTNIPAAQLTGALPAIDGSNLTGLTVNNANTLDNLDSTQFLRSDANDTASGQLTLTSSTQYPLNINSSANGKIVLQGSVNPFIRWQEGTTNKAYIQWNASGFLGLYNQEDASSLLIKDDIIFSQDGTNYHKVWHAGNDGSGSGLDADTVDGIQGASFLRSDTGDNVGGTLVFLSGSGINLSANDIYLNARVINNQKSGSDGLYLGYNNANYGVTRIYGGGSTSGHLGIHGTGGDSLKFLANKVFHAGNDGSGSGLDADTVDGIQASSFLRSDTSDTITGNITFSNDGTGIFLGGGGFFKKIGTGLIVRLPGGGQQLQCENNSGTVIGTYFHSGIDGSGSGLDADTVDNIQASSFLRSDADDFASGLIQLTSSSQYPLDINGANNGKLLLRGSSNPYLRFREGNTDKAYIQWLESGIFQFVNQESGEYLRIGSGSNGLTFTVDSSEKTVFHSGNDGSGSGLDADTLDGVQGSSFLRSDANDTATGAITLSNHSNHLSGHYFHQFYSGTKNYIHFYPQGHSGSASSTDIRTWNGTGADVFQINGGSSTGLKWRGNTIWTAENDGSGSGLDADTLDGVQASGLVAVGGDTMTGALRVDINSTVDGILGQAYTTYFGLKHSDQTYNTEYMILSRNDHTFISATTGANVRIRNGGNDGTNELIIGGGNDALTWRGGKVFHAGNDGSGSGLDSDTVDGLQASSFLRSDADDIVDARLTFENNQNDNHDDMATSSSYLGGMEIRNTGSGNDAFMAFHAGGDFACYFGLDADANRLAVGGWSMGAVKYSILHTNFASIRGSSAGQGFDIRLSMDGTRAAASVGHNATHHEGIFWHTSNNYGIYRTAGNWSGNYSQLRLDWPTGIVISGGTQYGLSHVRFESHLLPNVDNTRDLGSTSLRWRNIYTNDLNLSNEGSANDVDGTWGSFTIQEGEEDLFLINKRNGKKYKINMTEVS